MPIKILQNRQNESRRAEIAEDARKTLADFRGGNYQTQPAKNIIAELRQSLNHKDSFTNA